MSTEDDIAIAAARREFTDALAEVLAENAAVCPVRRGRVARAHAAIKKQSMCVPKTPEHSARSDGEARREIVYDVMVAPAEQSERPEHLCPVIGVFGFCCNSSRNLAKFDVDEPHPN